MCVSEAPIVAEEINPNQHTDGRRNEAEKSELKVQFPRRMTALKVREWSTARSRRIDSSQHT